MAVPGVSLTGDALSRAQSRAVNAIQRFSGSAGQAAIKIATGERIVTPGDDPLAFATSRQFRSQIAGLKGVVSSSQANASALAVAIDGLDSVKTQVDTIKGLLLTAQSGSADERNQIQTQIDSALALIDSTVSSTRFGGRVLLDGTSRIKAYRVISTAGAITDFQFDATPGSLAQTPAVQKVKVNKIGSGLPTKTLNDGRVVVSLTVSVASTLKASKASLLYTAGAASGFAEFRVTGKLGSTTLRIESTAVTLGQLTATATAFNALAAETGVALASDGAGLKLTTVGFGDDDFVKVELLSASAANTAAFGGVSSAEAPGTSQTAITTAATASIQGQDVRLGGEFGKTARFLHNGFDLEIDFGTGGLANNQAAITTTVVFAVDQAIAGVVGASASSTESIKYGFGAFTTADLGRNGNGIWAATEASSGDAGSNTLALGNKILAAASIADLGSGGRNDIATGNFSAGLDSLNRAVNQIVSEQARLGSLQAIFNNAVGAAQTALGNATAADADVIGVDAASEIASLLSSQFGVASASGVLSQASSIQSSILRLIG